jgi:protein-S-isoprenylcysteine O-methyltransferase Ste14
MKSRWTVAVLALVFPIVIGGIIFASAGDWRLPFVWAVLGLMAAFYLALAALADESLIRERLAPGPGNRDRLTRSVGGILLLGHWVVAGLDVGRLRWSLIPWEIQLAGVLGYAAALGINFWAMRANRFYSSVVRVQTDRGQHVVTAGPYRFVRHPGYAATLFALLSGGAALGSWLAFVPALGFVAVFVRRTLLEDRLLQSELPGYAEYAQSVRSRLIPGLF